MASAGALVSSSKKMAAWLPSAMIVFTSRRKVMLSNPVRQPYKHLHSDYSKTENQIQSSLNKLRASQIPINTGHKIL